MHTNPQRYFAPPRALGFSLVELMIAMALGLILLAGVGVIFVSTQQSGQTKRALDNAQEALRYSHYSISRLVRVGRIDRNASNATTLRIIVNRNATTPDCLGNATLTDDVQVTFTRDALNNALVCTVGNDSGVISRGITNVEFRYETLGGRPWSATSAANAVSVRTRLVMGNLADAQFVATSRTQVLAGVSP
jgi:prepilin-type N-terminal cleavage/methylation domain-containing protein